MIERKITSNLETGSQSYQAKKLYFWRDKELAYLLKDDGVSEKHKFTYFIFYTLFFTGSFTGYFTRSEIASKYILQFGPIITLLYIMFYKSLYQTNARGDGRYFIERVICLTLPVAIRLLVILFAVVMILDVAGNIYERLTINAADASQGYSPIVYVMYAAIPILSVWYYFTRLNLLIKIASGQIGQNNEPFPAPQL